MRDLTSADVFHTTMTLETYQQAAGLIVLAHVCDNASNNAKALKAMFDHNQLVKGNDVTEKDIMVCCNFVKVALLIIIMYMVSSIHHIS